MINTLFTAVKKSNHSRSCTLYSCFFFFFTADVLDNERTTEKFLGAYSKLKMSILGGSFVFKSFSLKDQCSSSELSHGNSFQWTSFRVPKKFRPKTSDIFQGHDDSKL